MSLVVSGWVVNKFDNAFLFGQSRLSVGDRDSLMSVDKQSIGNKRLICTHPKFK
jgi:hypothetical protein